MFRATASFAKHLRLCIDHCQGWRVCLGLGVFTISWTSMYQPIVSKLPLVEVEPSSRSSRLFRAPSHRFDQMFEGQCLLIWAQAHGSWQLNLSAREHRTSSQAHAAHDMLGKA